jgi:hypothetical protein
MWTGMISQKSRILSLTYKTALSVSKTNPAKQATDTSIKEMAGLDGEFWSPRKSLPPPLRSGGASQRRALWHERDYTRYIRKLLKTNQDGQSPVLICFIITLSRPPSTAV